MSGVPSWAFSEPSTKRTAEWTTLCGWTTTSIAASSTSYSQRASTTSRPLLARVAESIVIFAPIDHVGWRSACSRRDRREIGRPVQERPARRRQDQRGHAVQRLSDEALPDRRVLGIDRAEPGQRAREGIRRRCWRRPLPPAPEPAASRGDRRQRASPCSPSPRSCRPARAASTGRRLTIPPVATTTRSTSSPRGQRDQRRPSPPRSRAPCRSAGPAARRSPAPRPSGGTARPAARARRRDHRLRARRRRRPPGGRQDVEGLRPDRPGRAEDRHPSASPARRLSDTRRRHTGPRPAPRTGTSRPDRGSRRAPG